MIMGRITTIVILIFAIILLLIISLWSCLSICCAIFKNCNEEDKRINDIEQEEYLKAWQKEHEHKTKKKNKMENK